MADLAYFIKLDQPLEHINQSPEYCMHCHIAGEGDSQPGVGNMIDLHTKLFRIFRDVGYTNSGTIRLNGFKARRTRCGR